MLPSTDKYWFIKLKTRRCDMFHYESRSPFPLWTYGVKIFVTLQGSSVFCLWPAFFHTFGEHLEIRIERRAYPAEPNNFPCLTNRRTAQERLVRQQHYWYLLYVKTLSFYYMYPVKPQVRDTLGHQRLQESFAVTIYLHFGANLNKAKDRQACEHGNCSSVWRYMTC